MSELEIRIRVGVGRLRRGGRLYICGQKNAKFDTARDVIIELYRHGSSDTRHSKDDRKQITGSYRTIRDIYRIVWHYLPNVTIEEVVKAIYSKEKFSYGWGLQVGLNASWCNDVRNVVHSTSSNHLIISYGGSKSSIPHVNHGELLRHYGII